MNLVADLPTQLPDEFAFQVDSLDVENWDCGDCAIHYFFLNGSEGAFSWCQEMC